MLVFMVGALAAFSYFSNSQITLNLEGRRRTAAEVAQSRLEELRTVSFNQLPSFQEQEHEVEVDGITGSRSTLIEDTDEDGSGSVDYSKITVTVTWPENGCAQEVELATVRSQYW